MSNNIPYHSLRSAAKERPLLSVFLGSFLTASVIPMIVFLMIIMGSLTIGVLAFTAFQSGVIVIASIVLCVCLVLPLFLSSVFALLAYCGLVVVNAVGWPLKESNNRQRLSVSYITARLRSAITNASPFRYFMTGNIDARGEGRCGFAQVAYNIFRNLIRVSEANTRGVRSNQQRDPARLVQLMPIIDSDDGTLPALLRPRQHPLAPLMKRRAPSFDFLTAPSRHTYDTHSVRVIQIRDDRISGAVTDN